MLSEGWSVGKWKGVTVAVKIVEHSAETEGELLQLRESLLSSSIVHPNVVSMSCPLTAFHMSVTDHLALRRHCTVPCHAHLVRECNLATQLPLPGTGHFASWHSAGRSMHAPLMHRVRKSIGY